MKAIGRPGPFQIIGREPSGEVESPQNAPRRRYACKNYNTCLDLACALNWDSFTCRGCSGEVDHALHWQAHHARRKDEVADRLCDLPEITFHESAEKKVSPLRVVSNK